MSDFEFNGTFDLQELVYALENSGEFPTNSWVENEIAAALDDFDAQDAVRDYIAYTGIDADNVNDFESAVEGIVAEFLANDNLDGRTLKEDLIALQDRVKGLETTLDGIADVIRSVAASQASTDADITQVVD